MGKREVSILDTASIAVAEIAWFIENKGLTQTAKRFVIDAYDFFATLSNTLVEHKLCSSPEWSELGYKCVPYKKKYTVVFSESETELIICEFISSKLVHC